MKAGTTFTENISQPLSEHISLLQLTVINYHSPATAQLLPQLSSHVYEFCLPSDSNTTVTRKDEKTAGDKE